MMNILNTMANVGTPNAVQQAVNLARVEREIQTGNPENVLRRHVEQNGSAQPAPNSGARSIVRLQETAQKTAALPAQLTTPPKTEEQKPPVSVTISAQNVVEKQQDKADLEEQNQGEKKNTTIEQLVDDFNKTLVDYTNLRFRVDKDVQEVVVSVIDAQTDQLIRQIPPQEMIKLVKKMREFSGLLFDKKV